MMDKPFNPLPLNPAILQPKKPDPQAVKKAIEKFRKEGQRDARKSA